MEIGKKLRLLRGSMPQADLARRSGVDKAIISKIESGKLTGTVDTHKRIAGVFGLKLSELYAYIEGNGPEAVEVRPAESRSDTYDGFLEILTALPLSKRMLPVVLTLKTSEERYLEETKQDAERYILVLDGIVDIGVEGASYRLQRKPGSDKGDSMYSRSAKRHRIRNIGAATARVLCVSCPPVL